MDDKGFDQTFQKLDEEKTPTGAADFESAFKVEDEVAFHADPFRGVMMPERDCSMMNDDVSQPNFKSFGVQSTQMDMDAFDLSQPSFKSGFSKTELSKPGLSSLSRPSLTSSKKVQAFKRSHWGKLEQLLSECPAEAPQADNMLGFNTYCTKETVLTIAADLLRVLHADQTLDFEFEPKKLKIAGAYTAGTEVTTFRVYILKQDGHNVINFQRRAGCSIAFNNLVKSVVSCLRLDFESAASLDFLAPAPSALVSTDVSLDASSVDTLFLDAKSENPTTRAHGISQLAFLASSPSNCLAIFEYPDLLSVLRSGLADEAQVRIASSKLIAILAKLRAFCEAVRSQGLLPELVTCLERQESRQVAQNLASCLASVHQHFPDATQALDLQTVRETCIYPSVQSSLSLLS